MNTHGKPSALHAGDTETKTVYTHGDMTVLEKSLGTKQQVNVGYDVTVDVHYLVF